MTLVSRAMKKFRLKLPHVGIKGLPVGAPREPVQPLGAAGVSSLASLLEELA